MKNIEVPKQPKVLNTLPRRARNAFPSAPERTHC